MTLVLSEQFRRSRSFAGLLAGLPVSASEWGDLSAAQRWLLAKGRQIVPAFKPEDDQLVKGTSHTYGMRIVPSLHAIQRVWSVTMRGAAFASVTVEGSTRALPASPEFSADYLSRHVTPSPVVINLGSQTLAESTTDLIIDSEEDGVVDCISCVEIPRFYLDDGATELASPNAPFRSGQPITAAAFERLAATHQDDDYGRRVHLHWAVPYKVNAVTSTSYARSSASTTWVDVLDVDQPILGRSLYTGDTTRTVTGRVLAWRSSSGVGQARLVSTSGGNGTAVALPLSTTPTWSDPFTVTVDAEDLTVADGRRGSAWDDIQVEFRRQSGSGTIYVASAIVYEA